MVGKIESLQEPLVTSERKIKAVRLREDAALYAPPFGVLTLLECESKAGLSWTIKFHALGVLATNPKTKTEYIIPLSAIRSIET